MYVRKVGQPDVNTKLTSGAIFAAFADVQNA